MPFKHIAYKVVHTEWVERKAVKGAKGEDVVVEIPRVGESDSIFFHWISDDADPLKSNPYPERTDVLFRTVDPPEDELGAFLAYKQKAAKRIAEEQARAKIEELKARSTWTVAQAREAILSIAKLLE